jgi:hypothetical protein
LQAFRGEQVSFQETNGVPPTVFDVDDPEVIVEVERE